MNALNTMMDDTEQKSPAVPREGGDIRQTAPKTTVTHEHIASHLANERTFLAWNFTALLIIGSGVVLARALIALNTSPLMVAMEPSQPVYLKPTTIGLVFMVAGLVVEVLATCRYLTVYRQIIEHRYRPSSLLVLLFLGIVLVLCIVLAWFLLQLRGTL